MTIGMTMITRAECWGTVTGLSVRGEIARCGQNLIFACFLVLPMYNSWQESQVNLYIMLEHNEAGSLYLNWKKDEILNELLKQNLNSI